MDWSLLLQVTIPIFGAGAWLWSRLDKKFEKIDERFEKIDKKFEKIDERSDRDWETNIGIVT